MKKLLLTIASVCAMAGGAKAATIVWNFSDDNATFDSGTPLNFTVSDFSIGNTFGTVADPVNSTSPSSGYTGSTGTGNIGNAFRIGALNTAAGGSGYLELTITAGAGFTFNLTNFDFGTRSTPTAPQAFALRSSVDSFSSDIFTGTVANNSAWSFKDNAMNFSSTVDGGAVTFRLYGYNGTGSPGSGTINGRFDDFTLDIIAIPTAVPEPSTYMMLLGGALMMVWVVRRKQALI